MNAPHLPDDTAALPTTAPKRPYATPALTFFGHVAELTQSASGCSNNDSATCATGSTMGPKASDRRLKTNVVRVGTHPRGIGLYLFDYIGGTRRRFGVMADEVEAVLPAAVSLDHHGFRQVDYRLLGIELSA
jgi:hypothetical protein